MNAPIRRLSILVSAMFAILLVFGSWVQFADAKSLRDAPNNSRTLYSSYEQERGSILVDQTTVARSEKTNGPIKYMRSYPQGLLYSHLTGWFSMNHGSSGLEETDDELLSGQSDSLFYRRLGDMMTGKRPTGVNLELTLDAKTQQAADKALGNRKGAIVALDPKTGAILAMVSHPQYDPNAISSLDATASSKAWQQVRTDPNEPLINRAITGKLYPAGSTFKVITSAAALNNGRTENSTLTGVERLKMPGTSVTLPNDWNGPCGSGQVTLTQALAMSCNTAFGQVGMDMGAQVITDQAAKFGFGKPLSIPMRVTPASAGPMQTPPQIAFTAIGQQDVRVSPLQMAMVAAGVANKGAVMKPFLVKQTRGSGLDIIDTTRPQKFSQAVSEDVAAALTRMMVQVTESPQGTGHAARIPGVQVAGKSGTAEHGSNAAGQELAPHAWFISFAPADDPKVAVAVLVEDGGLPSPGPGPAFNAAPLAQEVMKAVINR
ncbi:Penicillin-binding protein A [Austwickia sp. TVS 96-490-7B]|uniref:peptidoglycan D,D-transpeptidase FtsI family protein n=1 Tax=Austwickia sp. TVS 96-490-7B TaxID=2830843 RepID=UPI001C55E0BC|nr:penicillin-binding transpeptidase domain-containing protein [Austwickia sp. TVS 96-490-7B]MBW3084221.1 Penicillin-binding protein A [Austwickia sp. TVS 96-490-7B]